MIRSLPAARAKFLLASDRARTLDNLAEPLKDAPMRVRRLGLPLAVAVWSRQGHDELVELLSNWLFSEWGALEGHSIPQGAGPMLQELMTVEQQSPTLRSAMEIEAEELLQVAKLLSDARSSERHG